MWWQVRRWEGGEKKGKRDYGGEKGGGQTHLEEERKKEADGETRGSVFMRDS